MFWLQRRTGCITQKAPPGQWIDCAVLMRALSSSDHQVQSFASPGVDAEESPELHRCWGGPSSAGQGALCCPRPRRPHQPPSCTTFQRPPVVAGRSCLSRRSSSCLDHECFCGRLTCACNAPGRRPTLISSSFMSRKHTPESSVNRSLCVSGCLKSESKGFVTFIHPQKTDFLFCILNKAEISTLLWALPFFFVEFS